MVVQRRPVGRGTDGSHERKLGRISLDLTDLQELLDMLRANSGGIAAHSSESYQFTEARDLNEIPRKLRLPLRIATGSPHVEIRLDVGKAEVRTPSGSPDADDLVYKVVAHMIEHRRPLVGLVGPVAMIGGALLALWLGFETSNIAARTEAWFLAAVGVLVGAGRIAWRTENGATRLLVSTPGERENMRREAVGKVGWLIAGGLLGQGLAVLWAHLVR